MATFAVMSGNFVSNIIVANNKETAETATNTICIEYTLENPAAIGWTYDSEINKFVKPKILIEETTGE